MSFVSWPVPTLRTVTFAPLNAPPVVSVMVPLILPRSTCAKLLSVQVSTNKNSPARTTLTANGLRTAGGVTRVLIMRFPFPFRRRFARTPRPAETRVHIHNHHLLAKSADHQSGY